MGKLFIILARKSKNMARLDLVCDIKIGAFPYDMARAFFVNTWPSAGSLRP